MADPQTSIPHPSTAVKRRVRFISFMAVGGMLLLSQLGNLMCRGDLDTYQAEEKAKRDAAARDKTIITVVPN